MESILLIKNNKVICKFCNNHCIKANRERKRYWWWECKNCDVRFLVSLKGELDVIEFESKEEGDRFYTVHLLIKNKRTDICAWTKDKVASTFGVKLYNPLPSNTNKNYYTQSLVTSFNKVVEFTPTNFNDKLKNYLLLL